MTGAMTTAQRRISRDELLAALRDLPPLPSVVLELVESLGHEELGGEHGTSRRATHGVVREAHEAVIEERVGAEAPDGHAHAIPDVTIEPGLRA